MMKKRCAQEALKHIRDGMIVGLGGGSTISYLIEYIKESELDIKVVSPSSTTIRKCVDNGFNVLPTSCIDHIDIAFDGCDEVDLSLNCLKSMGAIHTKEKIIALMADEYILLVDESKVFETLPLHLPIALEVYEEAIAYVIKCLKGMDADASIRLTTNKDGGITTDNGHYIIDAKFENVQDLEQLNKDLLDMSGVIDTSLFYRIATKVISVDHERIRYIGG